MCAPFACLHSLHSESRSSAFQALSGTWSSSSDIAPQATRTYFSQHTYTLPLGSNGVYMGDRWRPQQLGGSRYIWLPMSYSSGSPQLVWADVWSINVGAGTYTVHTGTTYEAENGSRGGASTLMDNSGFSGGRGIGYLGTGLRPDFSSTSMLILLYQVMEAL